MNSFLEMNIYLNKVKACCDAFMSGKLNPVYDCNTERYNSYGSRFSVWSSGNNDVSLFTVFNEGDIPCATVNTIVIFDAHGEENNPLGRGSFRYRKGGTIPNNIDGTNENISTADIGEFNEETFFQYSLLCSDRALLCVCLASFLKDYPLDFFTLNLNFVDEIYEVQKYIKSSKDVT